MKNFPKWILFFFLVMLACLHQKSSNFRRSLDSDYSFVVCGRYPHRGLHPVRTSYGKLIKKIRKEIECRERPNGSPLPNEIAQKCPETKDKNLEFAYRSAFLDEKNGKILMHYFAGIPHHQIFAGYAEHFIVNLRSKRIERVYVFPVPLE
ncbi:MAG: hypothetical protein AB1393_03440 [Candidatus Edwardsbacteria bacterium]